MLQLKNIVKNYTVGDSDVAALRGVSLAFRKSEFVSILGPSGCGKTTMLNIIGGLDRYTSGDLVINGKSTKEFSDRDWDSYRNHSVGFVFQSYNLIPHQSVLANVELALTLSGVSKAERRKRAEEALRMVGLGDQIRKKPNQMSGGQMQRVAIARALVNDPDILLADEPTGALDSETSVQVMELLKEISKDRLIIMVTHNRELAEKYSSRIVSLLDGSVTGDTLPYTDEEIKRDAEAEKKQEKTRGTSMSFFTALSLSFNNLMTKRTRTLLTSFAGSIGIIGIALILAMSTGVQAYINKVQRDTISSYPLTLEAEQADYSSLLSAMGSGRGGAAKQHDQDAVYANSGMYEMFNAMVNVEATQNDLGSFKKYLEEQMTSDDGEAILKSISSVQYLYPVSLNTYVKRTDGKFLNTDISEMFGKIFGSQSGSASFLDANPMAQNMPMMNMWEEILPGKNGALVSDLIYDQYDLVYGKWPENANEIVLVLDKNNEISDMAFYALGMIPDEEIKSIFSAVMKNETIEFQDRSIDYADVCEISFRLLTDADYYSDSDGDGVWKNISDDEALMELKLNNAYELKICGVIRPNSGAAATAISGTFGYTCALTEYVIDKVNKSEVVLAQKDEKNANRDIFTGLPFVGDQVDEPTDWYKAEKIREYFASLTDKEKTELYLKILSEPNQTELDSMLEYYMKEYDSRDKIISTISASYGMPEEEMQKYLETYTDDELRLMLKEYFTKVITENYKQQAEAEIENLMTTPPEDVLNAMINQIIGSLDTKEKKVGFVAFDWSSATTMSYEDAVMYLMSADSDVLDNAVYVLAEKNARTLYASESGSEERGYAVVAEIFDKKYTNSTDTAVLTVCYDKYMPSETSESTLEKNLEKLGVADYSKPSRINIYTETFEDKDKIADFIAEYNSSVEEEKQISYTDYIALLMSGITNIINAISYGLIIFVSVSLVVSSIMIGIITYISVLERTKEIGILRAIGASKRDISRVFNAETLIIGFCAGMIGIGISLLLCIPISMIVHALSGISAINAFLEPMACVVLVLISMALTFIAGLIPSGIASKKDPVEALRSE